MSGLFLQLLGTDSAGRKLAFRARLEGSTIKTSVHDLGTGREVSAASFRNPYRITFLDPAPPTPEPLTTFDLLPDISTVAPGANPDRLTLNLGVRCLLLNDNADPTVRLRGELRVITSAGAPRIEFRGLEAVFPTAVIVGSERLPFGSSGNFSLADLRQDQLTQVAGLTGNPLLRIVLGISGTIVRTRSIRAAFRNVGQGEDRRTLLAFELVIGFLDSSRELFFRRRRFEARGDSDWRFVQRAPSPDKNDLTREREDRTNRWIASTRTGPDVRSPLFQLWNQEISRPYTESLRTIQGGRAISLMPVFQNEQGEDLPKIPLLLFYEFREPDPRHAPGPGATSFSFPDDQATQPSQPRIIGRVLSLQPLEGNTTEVLSRLPGLLIHDGKPLPVQWTISTSGFDPMTAERARGIVFRAVQSAITDDDPRIVRLGALDLTFGKGPVSEPRKDLFSADIVRTGGIERLDVSVETLLAVTAAAPGGQDGLPQEEFSQDLPDEFEREPAIVIPVGKSPEPRRFLLEATERTFDPDDRAPKSQTLEMRLLDLDLQLSGEAAQRQDVIVLDRQPFLVARVEVPPLQGIVQEGIREVANWSGDSPHGASWELRAGEGFTMHLPPQGVGEAMEKIQGPTDIREGEAADFRFTPPAQFDLQASFFEQRFAEAPWNLRRILGYPGQRAPGAGIRNLRFEMLYGMECEVDTPFLRLAEIASRLGEIQGDLPEKLPWKGTAEQEDALKAFRKEWGSIFERYFSRLAVLEPWDEDQPDELTLDDGV
ncbi:MAG TPA: hypothetical protein VJ725_23915, partial [Thermoanaerobaculia bacterium]|nr:hypothetical protein [Thermoanaerobaculia bacterium]